MSFLAAGIKIRFTLRRAIIALGFSIDQFFIALSTRFSGRGHSVWTTGTSLLVIAYWMRA
jgi:NCS1 family nucleobase:cation symporter-1